MALDPDNEDVLYRLASECEVLFDQLQEAFPKTQPEVTLCADFQQRFAIWAAHLGVFARKSQCLDTRLRNLPDLQDLVARLLDILRHSLQQCKIKVNSQEKGDTVLIGSDEPSIGTAETQMAALRTIDETLTRLDRLGVTIRQSNRDKIHTRVKDFAAGLDLNSFAYLCASAVQTLYPGAHQSLKHSLSESMTDRYAMMLFLNSRNKKLETRRESRMGLSTIPEVPNNKMQTDTPINQLERAIKSRFEINHPTAPTSLSQSDLSSVNINQIRSRLRPPDESSSKFHKTSSIQVNQGNYPQLSARNADSSIFACEWCSEPINSTTVSESEWRRHIDRDLKPYICLSGECSEVHRFYPTFDEWFKHMELHDRRWHQHVYPTFSWVCTVCQFNQSAYNSPQGLYSHLEESHGSDFTNVQLQAISRQSKMEQPRAWNDCLLCCFAVEDQGIRGEAVFPKRRKGHQNQETAKSARMTLEMTNPEPHSLGPDSSDTSSDSDGMAVHRHRSQQSNDSPKAVARHIAVHLQGLMLLTLRFAALQNHDEGLNDDINSDSVDVDEGNSAADCNDLGKLSDVSSSADVTMKDMNDARDGMDLDNDVIDDDIPVPDTDLDLKDFPRQCDHVTVDKDDFLRKVVASGAYQSWRHENNTGTSRPNHGDYTVGWISALPAALVAARAMLDDIHADLPQPEHDTNTYILGRVGKHNVVLAPLPAGFDISDSPTVAAHMVTTFVSIKFVLMVGIGSGFPPKVRLGDVVVSKPVEEFSAVVQCDYGKRGQGSTFQKTGVLNNPPTALLAALTKLESKHQTEGSEIPRHLEGLRQKIKQKWPSLAPRYLRNDSLQDILFKSNYRHVELKNEEEGEEQDSCAFCDHTQIVRRDPAVRDMRVHYGLIASGNQVIMDAVRRDEINNMLGGNVLCFDMDEAGLMNNLPCIVIRGICDYADSHRNRYWLHHAAAVAAAFGKEFLSVVPTHEVEEAATVKSLFYSEKKEQKLILEWMTPIDYSYRQSDAIRRRHPNTGRWLLDSDKFRAWENQANQILFCPGIPGAGKTIATSTVVDLLHARFPDGNTTGIAYIYCNFRERDKQHPVNLLLNLLKQFTQGKHATPECVKSLYEKHKTKRSRPSVEEISDTLGSVMAGFSRTYIIIDALDEYENCDGIRSKLLLEIFDLQAKTGTDIFVTSRFIPEITEEFKRRGAVLLEIRASDNDVRRYLDDNISQSQSNLWNNPELEERIKDTIITATDGMFLLARLHLDSLEEKLTMRQVKDAVAKLRTDIDVYSLVYELTMERIQSQQHGLRDLAFKTLSWISCARRPLSPLELQHALAVVNKSPALDVGNITKVDLIISVCAGLVIIDEESDIVRFAHYTAQEYFQQTWSTWFPNAEMDIAQTCIAYLSFDKITGVCPTDDSYEERLRLNPLYSYAARNWGHHSRVASMEVEQLITFLENEDKVSASIQALLASRGPPDYSQTQMTKMSGVHLAAYFGLEKVIKALFENGHEPDSKDSDGLTPLAWAAKNGHEDVVKLLLDTDGVDPNSKSNASRPKSDRWWIHHHGITPLLTAAENGHTAVVRLLLTRDDIDLGSKSNTGETPLLLAAENGHEATVKLLLEEGFDPNLKEGYFRETPLTAAATNGHDMVVKLLLEEGVDPNSLDGMDRTPLSWAAEYGQEEVVKLLLNTNKVNANVEESDGMTPLIWAESEGQETVVKLLQEHLRKTNISLRP